MFKFGTIVLWKLHISSLLCYIKLNLRFFVRMKIVTKTNCVWAQICLCATRYVHSLVSWHVDNSAYCCLPKDDTQAPLSKGELILFNLLEKCRFSGIFLILCYNNYLFIIKRVAFLKKRSGRAFDIALPLWVFSLFCSPFWLFKHLIIFHETCYERFTLEAIFYFPQS